LAPGRHPTPGEPAPGGLSSVTSAPGARWAWDFCTPQLRRGVYERNSAPECRFPTGQTTGRPSARAWPRLAALRPPPFVLHRLSSAFVLHLLSSALCPAPSVVGPRRPSSGAEPSGPPPSAFRGRALTAPAVRLPRPRPHVLHRPPSGSVPSGTLRLPGSSPLVLPPSGPEPADIAPSRWAEAAPCESIGS